MVLLPVNKGELVGILLAAGRSTRFGSHKGLALLPDGMTMALRSALNLARVVDRVCCVVRVDDSALQAQFRRYGLDIVEAADAGQGMGASLSAGIRATAGAAGWVIALADMPLIQAATYQSLVQAFRAYPAIVVPQYQYRRGHPVIFSEQYCDDLLQLSGDQGARSLLKYYAPEVREIMTDDPGVCQDFDTRISFDNYCQSPGGE